MFNPVELRKALDDLPPGAWSHPSTFASTGVHHGYRRVVLAHLEAFRFVLDRFEPVADAWLSRIDPGGFIVPHRDAGPYRERWQIPIATAGTLNGIPAEDGVPFQVWHWLPHWVENPSDRPRIHLVIDRAVIVNPATDPFTVEDTCPAEPKANHLTTGS